MSKCHKFARLLTILTAVNILAILSFIPNYTKFIPSDGFQMEAAEVINTQDLHLYPLGLTVGIKVDTEGVIVIGTSSVIDAKGNTTTPAQGILMQGDHILYANNIKLTSKEELIEIIEKNTTVNLEVRRLGEMIDLEIPTVKDHKDINRLGIWVRDIAQGIGTITYYNPESGKFGALGHGIMDKDTRCLMEIRGGEITKTDIAEVKKGKKGNPGELVGFSETDEIIGCIKLNTEHGIYGYLTDAELSEFVPLPVARYYEIKEDKATIFSSVEGDIKSYDVFIESVNKNATDNSKGLVVKITDEDLLEKTNGIVQGMSGSPIVQDGKIIGAITHVFVQDPSKGYGIFIENMLKQEVNI